MTLPRLAVVLGLVLLAACGDAPPYELPTARPVKFYVTLKEELTVRDRTAWRQVALSAEGTTPAGATDGTARLELEFRHFTYEAEFADGRSLYHSSEEFSADATVHAPDDRAVFQLFEELRGSPLVLTLDPRRGLTEIEGVTAALDLISTRGDAVAAAREGVVGWIADEPLRDLLRAGGLQAIPEDLSDLDVDVRRTARVALPALGYALVPMSGLSGAESDGSPTTRYEGRLDPTADFEGTVDALPLGSVVLDRVEARGGTLHVPATLRPLRGHFRYEIPFASTPEARTEPDGRLARAMEFSWLIEEE